MQPCSGPARSGRAAMPPQRHRSDRFSRERQRAVTAPPRPIRVCRTVEVGERARAPAGSRSLDPLVRVLDCVCERASASPAPALSRLSSSEAVDAYTKDCASPATRVRIEMGRCLRSARDHRRRRGPSRRGPRAVGARHQHRNRRTDVRGAQHVARRSRARDRRTLRTPRVAALPLS